MRGQGRAGTVVELGVPGREGSGCCGSNVRKSLGWGPGGQGEGRSESSWDGYGEEASEGDKPREECGDREGPGVGMGNGPVRAWCGDRKGSGVGMGKSPLWGQGRVLCGDAERSGEGMGRDLVWGWGRVQCGDLEGSSVLTGNGLVWGWGMVQ